MDTFSWTTLAVILVGLAAYVYRDYIKPDSAVKYVAVNNDSESESANNEPTTDNTDLTPVERHPLSFEQDPNPSAMTLLTHTLDQLNLQYHYEEDTPDSNNEAVIVSYQGEKIRIVITKGYKFIEVHDNYWYNAPLEDIENLSILHRAVNTYNFNSACARIVYTHDTNDNTIDLHTFCNILWVKEIPDIDQYLLSTFNTTLQAHQVFYSMMENIRRERHANNI